MPRRKQQPQVTSAPDHDQAPPGEFTVPHGSSEIKCICQPSSFITGARIMVFTHGAGGTISSPAIANFVNGFGAICSQNSQEVVNRKLVRTIYCFQGTMNLKSRVSMFQSVMNKATTVDRKSKSMPLRPEVLGGSSMGARAAVMTANEANSESRGKLQVEALVLASYPLQGQNGQIRDQILLEIDARVRVLFIIGDKDHMCDLSHLEDVRKKMNAKSWLVTVEGAGHGLSLKSKKTMEEVQLASGRIAAEWAMEMPLHSTSGDVGGLEGCKMEMSLPADEKKVEKSANAKSPAVKSSSKKRRIEEAKQSDEEGPARRTRRQTKK